MEVIPDFAMRICWRPPSHAFPFEMAADYLFHIAQDHPFVDGNKRTGAVAALLFLDLHGIEINAPPGALYDLTMAVATGTADKQAIAEFFQTHATDDCRRRA